MSEKSGKEKGKDKAKDKGKDKPKEKESTGPSIEWDSNASSSCCILCKTAWGTFRNRRHHCRNCGRLICENCSSQRFKLAEGSNELPQRVCDTCYDMLKQKREMKIQVVQLKDKHLELMLATSMISDSLINLFYLDGSTKTIGIDETTTIQELASLACPFMSVALFEVVQNIQSVSQYKLLLPTQNVVALIDTWQQAGQPYIKIVIPLNNPGAAVNADGEFDIRQSIMDTGRASMAARPTTLVPSAANYTPTPAKSIYKVKQSPSVSSPIYLASSADLMGTSYDKNSDTKHGNTPPTSPKRQRSAQNLNAASNSQSQARSYDEHSSRNSSFSDTPSAGDVSKAASVASGANIRDIAAALVANQVKVHSLEAELAEMKAQLKKSQQKYDILHTVCFKSGQLDNSKLQMLDAFLQQQAGGGGLGVQQRYQGSGDSNTSYSTTSANSYPSSYGTGAGSASASTATTTVGTGVPVERKLSKRSSFSWGAAPFTRSTTSDNRRGSLMGSPDEGDGKGDVRGQDARTEESSEKDVVLNDRSAFSLTRKNVAVRTSIVGGNAPYLEGSTGSGREATTPPPHQQGRARTSTAGTLDASEVAGSDRPPSRNATPSGVRAGDEMSETDMNMAQMSMNSGSMNDKILQESKSVQIMTEVFQDPARILSLNSGALNLMVRTFFCKVGEIEGFCNRYCRLFDAVLHSSFIHSIAASDLESSSYSGPNSPMNPLSALDPSSAPTTDPKLIVHLYHMIAAMDGVYEFLTEYHEDWRAGLRAWLLRTFDECVQMPVVRPDDLKSTIYCLQRENLILSTEVLDTIQACIDTSLHRNTPHGATITSNSRYKYSQSSEGGEGDIIGRGAEGQYVVGTGASGYNSAVLMQTMDNIITTYYSVIGDLLPTLPFEIDVFAVFQMKLTNIVKHYIKATFYQHKQIMSPPELIRMVAFYDKLAQFGDKFSKTTSPHMVKNVSEMRPDVLRQCNTAMVASLAEQMLKLFNADEPAMSADVDLLEKRNFAPSPDASAMMGLDAAGEGAGISSGVGNNSGGSGGMTKSASSSDLTNGYSGTGIFRCSTLWPMQLVGLLRQYLGWIPVDIDTQKKVYWCILLLDTLQEFHVKQTNWLTQGMKMNTINVGPLCKYVNNHTKFTVLLNDCIDEWGAELNEKHAIALFDKAEYTCGLFIENSSAGVEAIAQLLYAEMKDILKGSLFRSGWDDSVKCVMLLKASLHRHFTFLQQHLCSGVGAGDAANGGLEAVQQLLVYICECIVSIYIELLLTNSSLTMDLNTLSRLSEDLELITKLFEELRNKIYLSRMCLGRSPHIIDTSPPKIAAHKRKLSSLGIKPHLSNRKKSADHSAPEDHKRAANEEVPPGRNSSSIANIEEDSKATFKKALQPLTHVVLAVQMNNQYLPDFVKAELYEDFGPTSLNIWQLIMYWRKESKDDILSAYQKLFADWRAPPLEEPLVDISHYMSKVKAANIVK